MIKRLNGMFILFILLSSVFLAPIYGANNNSQDLNDSAKKVLDHIKSKVHDVNDYEASQLLYIMYNHSSQHQGFEFYVQYISGNDVEDLYHKAPYYKQYVDFWESKLDEFNRMTTEERINALYVVDDKAAEMQKLIDEDNTVKLRYCSSKSSEELIQLNKTATKISNAADKLDISQLKKLSNELEENQENYYDTFLKASMEFDALGLSDSPYQSDPYSNAVQARDEIYKSSGNYFLIWNTFNPGTGIMNEIKEGYILQFKINVTDSNPAYKYYHVKSINDNMLNVVGFNLSLLKNSAGEIINVQETEVHKDIPISIITNENSPYFIVDNDTSYFGTVDLKRVYRTDPTGINARINMVSGKPSNTVKGFEIGGIVTGCTLIIVGIAFIIVASCSGPGAIVTVPVGIGLIASGAGILLSAVIAFIGWKTDNDAHSNDVKIIEKIINIHNNAPFNS